MLNAIINAVGMALGVSGMVSANPGAIANAMSAVHVALNVAGLC